MKVVIVMMGTVMILLLARIGLVLQRRRFLFLGEVIVILLYQIVLVLKMVIS